MSMFVKILDAEFDYADLDLIRNTVLSFHNEYRNELISNYKPGLLSHDPTLGYYIPKNNTTHKTRKVSDWDTLSQLASDNLDLSTIKMINVHNASPDQYQNVYLVHANDKFTSVFSETLNRILSKIPFDFDPESVTLTVQEFGYSMGFHKDEGVNSRIHITLNRDPIDYFYTSDGTHKFKFGECCLIAASKTLHGFMSFQMEPRIHIMVDVN